MQPLGQTVLPRHDNPSHATSHRHACGHSTLPVHAPLVHETSHAPEPHVTLPEHDSVPEQVTVQLVAPAQSTSPVHENVEHRTSHGMPSGQVTAAHENVSQWNTQTPASHTPGLGQACAVHGTASGKIDAPSPPMLPSGSFVPVLTGEKSIRPHAASATSSETRITTNRRYLSAPPATRHATPRARRPRRAGSRACDSGRRRSRRSRPRSRCSPDRRRCRPDSSPTCRRHRRRRTR